MNFFAVLLKLRSILKSGGVVGVVTLVIFATLGFIFGFIDGETARNFCVKAFTNDLP